MAKKVVKKRRAHPGEPKRSRVTPAINLQIIDPNDDTNPINFLRKHVGIYDDGPGSEFGGYDLDELDDHAERRGWDKGSEQEQQAWFAFERLCTAEAGKIRSDDPRLQAELWAGSPLPRPKRALAVIVRERSAAGDLGKGVSARVCVCGKILSTRWHPTGCSWCRTRENLERMRAADAARRNVPRADVAPKKVMETRTVRDVETGKLGKIQILDGTEEEDF